jgi:hypothetical protein
MFSVSTEVILSLPLQDSEPDIIDGVGAEAGHVIRTTIGGRNGQSRQVRNLLMQYRNLILYMILIDENLTS